MLSCPPKTWAQRLAAAELSLEDAVRSHQSEAQILSAYRIECDIRVGCEKAIRIRQRHLAHDMRVSRVRPAEGMGHRNQFSNLANCVNGHAYTPGNTLKAGVGRRSHRCRICHRAQTAKYRAGLAGQNGTIAK